MRIYYGGTFDPIHDGHMATAMAAHASLNAEVFFIPSADPPHRNKPQANAVQRAEMVAIAIAAYPQFHLDSRELYRHGPSYTVDTLREIRHEIGNQEPLVWLIGADAFAAIDTWHQWQSLFDFAHFAVAIRPGYDWWRIQALIATRLTEQAEYLQREPSGRIFPLNCPPRNESASAIRDALAKGEPTIGLDLRVQAYISQHQLYR
jgi:nicotinate-nucleotide adenylyltransferase